jgi:transposase
MLRAEERFMIKDLYRQGVSISEIARRTGHDRKTVRQWVQAPLLVARPPRARRRQKIDPYVPYLEQRLAIGVLNAHKLFGEIRARGYPGGESQVRAFVHGCRAPRPAVATVRFETEPGEQAQVDWGHFGSIEHEGRRHWLYAFVMTLGWSRALYVEFTLSTEASWWRRGHLHAFRYFGGVPRQVLHDNLKTAVLGRAADGSIHWHPQYLDFAAYYGFTPRACQPYRAQTKGKVERDIRYLRGNFWPGLAVVDLADLNAQARAWLDEVANVRVHGTTGVSPFSRLPAEGLLPLRGKPPYDTSVLVARQSSRDCLVSYAGNHYSVPAAHARQQVWLKATEAGQLIVLTTQGEEVARHRLVAGQRQRVVDPAHYRDLVPLPAGRGRAVPLTQRASSAPDLATLVGAPLVERRPLAVYEQLAAGWEPREHGR